MNFLSLVNCTESEYKIYQTKDYNKFKFLDENRPIRENKVAKIKKTIKTHGFIPQPVIVDSDGFITEGQHRFIAAKEENVPVLFVVSDLIKLEDIADFNNTADKWSVFDDIRKYTTGKYNYLSYKLLYELYKRYNVIVDRSQCFDLDAFCIALFHKQTSAIFRDKLHKGLICITFDMYKEACKKLDYVYEIMKNLRDAKIKINGPIKCLTKALLYCYDYKSLPNDRIKYVIEQCFSRCQAFNDIFTAFDAIEKEYRLQYSPRLSKNGIRGIYEEDPDRLLQIQYYKDESQQTKYFESINN